MERPTQVGEEKNTVHALGASVQRLQNTRSYNRSLRIVQARNQEEEPYLDQACENWVEAMRLTGILQSKSNATKMGFGDFGKGAAAS